LIRKKALMNSVAGFYYDDQALNGWVLGHDFDTAKSTWVLTDDKRRCITHNRVLVKWSLIGTQVLMWHPQEVKESDFMGYYPPAMPKGIEIVRKNEGVEPA
jgi:hypothetical protein